MKIPQTHDFGSAAHLSDGVKIAVVIPCFRVARHICDVLSKIPDMVWRIYVVDDKCPEGSGSLAGVVANDRVQVLRHAVNQGVGGAVKSGYKKAILDGADIIIKIDGDGQMDPALIPLFVAPIYFGEADYCKGNRFFNLDNISNMPPLRIFGNAILSLINKISSGYWNIFDPTNGFTAIRAEVIKSLPFDKISNRYFFESDMLFRLNLLRAVVRDIPMNAVYGDEISGLKIRSIIFEFLVKNVKNTVKRIFYNYYLRDVSLASLELPLGIGLILFGTIFGVFHWYESAVAGVSSSAGTVMIAALPIIVGIQFVLAFIGYDISSVPKLVIKRNSESWQTVSGDA